MDNYASQLSAIAIFCKAAQLSNFTEAAKAIALTPAAVSRSISRLEDRLGVKLFRRTTRRVSLTDDGRAYFEQCRVALTQIEDAERSISGQQSTPRGVLRISAPTTYAHYRLLPRIGEFRKRYPQIQLDINVSNRNIDFVEEGYDVAIRLGQPPDSRLVARKLEDASLVFCASVKYLRKFGTPKSLSDLRGSSQHTLLPFVMPSTGKVLPWLAREDGVDIDFLPRSVIAVSDDPLACVSLARAAAGIAQTFAWVTAAHRDHASDELVEILKHSGGRTRPFYLLYPQNKHLSAKVRALTDFLSANA
jgi:DNA-binding transcriptional LysR family regulator